MAIQGLSLGAFRGQISLEMIPEPLFRSQFCMKYSGKGFVHKFLSMQKSLGDSIVS